MMTRIYHGLPTYTFANDPLPPAGTQPRGQADIQQPAEFVPTATVRLGDTQFMITERVDGSTPWRKTGNTDFEHFLAAISRSHPPGGQSPLAGEARELYQVLSDAGLSRFAAAMLWHEKKNDTWNHTQYATGDPALHKRRSRSQVAAMFTVTGLLDIAAQPPMLRKHPLRDGGDRLSPNAGMRNR